MISHTKISPRRPILIVLLALTILRLVFAAEISFLEDEAYYRLWGLYPNYAYFDHAPMVGWWIAIGQMIFGDTHLGLRFLSPISGLIGSLFLWRLTFVAADRASADLAVLIFNAMFLVGIGSVIMTPDIPSVFFWTLSLWAIVEWNHSNKSFWWLIFGIVAGLGLLSKYTNVFFGAGLVLWLIVSGRWRAAIREPQFWIAGIITFLIFTPVLYWNATHDWASFAKQFGRLNNSSYTLRYFVEWIGGQILMLSPVLSIFVGRALFRNLNPARVDASASSLIMLTSVPMLLYFLFNVFSSRINANWTAPIFVNLAILASFEIQIAKSSLSRLWRGLAGSAVMSGFAIHLFVLLAAMVAFLPADKRNPISNIRGYEDLANAIEVRRLESNAEFVVTSRYSLTGLLSYELRNRAPVIQLTDPIRFENLPRPEPRLSTARLLYVTDDRNVNGFIVDAKSCFKTILPIDPIKRFDRDVALLSYHLWLIEGVDPELIRTGDPKRCKH